jgi:hypothetical protein
VTTNTNLTEWSDWAAANTGEHDQSQQAVAQAAQVAFMLGTTEKEELVKAATAATSISRVASSGGVLASPEDCLVGLLAAGWEIPAITNSPFVLNANERLFARMDCDALVWQAVPRKKGHAWVGGASPVGLALLAVSAAGNAARTAKAAHDAAAQWRPMGHSVLCVTSQRVLRYVNSNWNVYSVGEIARLDLSADRAGVIIRVVGKESTPFLYQVAYAPLLFAVLRHVAPETAVKSIDAAAANSADEAGVVYSEDRRWWWDGTKWNDVHVVTPPDAGQ